MIVFGDNRNKILIEMLMALGDAYLEKGLYAEAAKRYQLLINFNIRNKIVYTNLSKALIGLKKFDKYALSIFQKAVHYDPGSAELYNILASSFLNEGREDPYAIQIYETALKYESPIFNRIADHLGIIYFKKGDFLKCKGITEKLLNIAGFQQRTFSLFFQSCWKTSLFDDAIEQLKKLIGLSNNNEKLFKYLCITYLEKKFLADIQNKTVRLSHNDKYMISDFLNKNSRFQHLQDLSIYIDLKRLLLEQENWGDINSNSVEEQESVYDYQSLKNVHSLLEDKEQTTPYNFNIKSDVLERLISFEDLTERSIGSRSKLTFEDFKKDGADIFNDSEIEARKWEIPEDAEILITIELTNYDKLHLNFGVEYVQQIRKKMFVILIDLLEKYHLNHIWGTSNGLLIFASEILPAVSFSVEILNKFNLYNLMSDSKEEIHLAIGIHHAREGFGKNTEQTLKDFATGLKVGIVREKDLLSKDRSILNKTFRKGDRILLTGRAYREIKSSNRFKVQTVGQFNLKYLKETLGLHEVAWRNPLDDLKVGYIKRLGRFDLLAELDSKSAFKVYKAKDSILQRFVILKVVHSEAFNSLPPNNQQKKAFYDLAKSFGRMSHPNIANIYEVDEDHGLTYISREFVEGISITELFRDTKQLNQERLIQIIYQICKGLHYSHQNGFYHLNLKPSNIRIGLNDQTKIMDFLIPRDLFEDYENLEKDHDRIYYLSPEQLQGKLGDVRSDIFSLGTILYQVVTRINPFSGGSYEDVAQAIRGKNPPPPSELNPELPKICESIILRCLAKNPEGRFETVNQIITMLKNTFEQNGLANFNYHMAQSRDSY